MCVCVCVLNHLGQEVVGGYFNWSMAAGGPCGESFTVKSMWAPEHMLVLLSSGGCLNKQHPDTGM